MIIYLRPATLFDTLTYLRIANAVRSPLNRVASSLEEAEQEIRLSNAFIIEVDDIDVGYASLNIDSKTAYISELQIHPDYQGQGIGAQSLDMIINSLSLEGVELFYLYTHPSNEARKLYARAGFEVVYQLENWNNASPRLHMQLLVA